MSEAIPEKWLERELCVRYGFCGQEYRDIVTQLESSDTYELIL